MINMLVEGPSMMSQKFRPKEPVETGGTDVAKWIQTHLAFGYYFGPFGTKNGSLVPYLEFGPFLVSRYDIESIGAIFGVQVTKFRHVFKGAVKLKGDIGLESDLQLEQA